MNTPLIATDHRANVLCPVNPEPLPHSVGMPKPPFGRRNAGRPGETDTETPDWEALILAAHPAGVRRGFKTSLAAPPAVRLNRRMRRAARVRSDPAAMATAR
jgi:hypothetical protein